MAILSPAKEAMVIEMRRTLLPLDDLLTAVNEKKLSIEPLPCPLIYSKLGPDYKLDLDMADDLERPRQIVIDDEDINLPGHVFVERAVELKPAQ